jgi:uncharacterized protein (DUF486 family)
MAYLYPIILLSLSNLFMTVAWYGHLKFMSAPLWVAVMASWTIALAEYWLAVPANRIGMLCADRGGRVPGVQSLKGALTFRRARVESGAG